MVEKNFKERILKLLETDEEIGFYIKKLAKEVFDENRVRNIENMEIHTNLSVYKHRESQLSKKIESLTNDYQKEKKRSEELQKMIELREAEISELSKANNKLQIENQQFVNDIENLNYRMKEKEEEKNELSQQLEIINEEKKVVVNEFLKLKNKYVSVDEVYNKYLCLGKTVIKKLERILNPKEEASETIEVFVAYGSQEGNIVALWEVIATEIEFFMNENKLEDITEIFSYFLKLIEKVSFKKITVAYPNIGDGYDERFHTRTSNSRVTGMIEQVILPGFTIGKSINKKALVVVK